VLLRDAVKRALPDGAPKPGAFRKNGDDQKPAKQAKEETAYETDAAEINGSGPAEGGDRA